MHTPNVKKRLSSSKNANACFDFINLRSRNRNFTDEEVECLKISETQTNNSMKTNDLNDSLSIKETKVIANIVTLKQNSKPDPIFDKLTTQYVNGLIKIQDTNGIILNPEGSYYLNFKLEKDQNLQYVNIGEQLRNIPKFMNSVWGMKSPQIIIPIITGLTNFKNWKNQKLEEQFRRGIIKAANKTEMWFITNGINGGISEMVGDAFNEEKVSRSTTSIKSNFSSLSFMDNNESSLKPLTLIGIVSASTLQNWSFFDGVSSLLTASGNKTNKNMYRFDINPDHTHFIIYDDLNNNSNDLIGVSSMVNIADTEGLSYDRFRDKVESLLTRSLSYYKKVSNKLVSDASDDEFMNPKIENRQVPVVCLVIRGDLKSIDVIESKIRKEIPVMILKGTGAVSDIIAFAYEELNENKDPEYEDSFIRPEISKKLSDEFKDELNKNEVIRNQFRDKILSIVKNGSKAGQKFLTIVDTKGLAFDFADLDKYILTALLQSQTQLSGKQGKAQLERNLRLTLDWNCPALALSEIFQRDDYTNVEIKHNVFDNAILRKDREEFVELFLDQGFYIHRYLGRNNIRELFTKTEDREFFVTIILQGILGHFTNELPENFLPDGLNEVLKELTSIDNMVNILEIYMNQLGFYVIDAKQAEKKALNFLIIFSVLFNRHKLAKILWKRTEDPLAIALVCSLIYKNLLPYCQESYLRSQIEKYQKDFADSAIGVLDASFKQNDPRSYSVLTYKHPDWNDCTVLELAYNAKNLDFIAHPACQKILTKRLFGSIQVRDIDNGFIDFPAWIKVILSAFLIFPMYYWIVFPIHQESTHIKHKKKRKDNKSGDLNQIDNIDDEEEDRDEEEEEAEQTKAELNKKLIKEMNKNRKHSQLLMSKKDIVLNKAVNSAENIIEKGDTKKSKYTRQLSQKCNYVTPPFYEKIYLVWSSPFTKFWINFISYIGFLFLFGIVTLWPCCGNLILDSILWLWTATITIEDTRIAYKNYLTGSQLPMTAPILEIAAMLTFLVMFFFIRILGAWDGLELFGMDRIFMSKALLCVFLLYFYYRTLFIFLPISHQLGPMLVRMKLMVKHDFMTYLRLFLISMTAGGIALNAILYPFHPLNLELLKKVLLLRGFLQLFVADKADLERETEDCRITKLSSKIKEPYSCVNLTNGIDFRYTQEKLESYGVSYKCNYISLMAWFILIQYFLLIKLFLPTLLTAMFSATGSRVNEKSEQLWMFQRYEIVLDYEKRLIFPPPFTVILYAFMILKSLVIKLKNFICQCKVCCRCFCLKHKKSNEQSDKLKSLNDMSNFRSTNTFNYWRNIAQQYSQNSEKEANEKSKQKQIETNLNKVREDLSTQKKSLQRLNDRVISLEKSISQNQSYLEQIKNLISQKQSKSGLLDRKKRNYIHILSRESPYVNTNIPRFFVYEKLVSWDMSFEFYDPPFVVLAPESFKLDKIFIDDEINPKVRDEILIINLGQSQTNTLPPPPTLSRDPSKELQSPSKQSSKEQIISNFSLQSPSSPILPRADSDPKSSQQQLDQQTSRTRKSSQTSMSQQKQNVFLWNAIAYIDNPLQIGKKITIDRKSWISTLDEKTQQMNPLIYSLDSIGYPRNPMGRTGVRGRGALLRYGPNHEIMLIVTRWKKQKNKPIYVERRKLLEFIAVKDNLTGLTKIPGERILGDESKFSVVCRTFMELVFEESDVEKGTNFNEEDMMSFFASFASQTPINYDKNNKQAQFNDILNDVGFVPTMIYKGYIDDPRNTDNAWVEAEVWNFHYDKDDFFDKRIKNAASKWREVSSNVRINSNEIIGDALKEISEIHNAFFN
ncbi:unnamed protein product [Brachionus calyciflorus]|uniref:Uncharacterized protein n=1 Tax=Brachionus calyciflorus TaxID=104777 RepID=A0A813WQ50_9BILA|nr:unnamed protein product [Brachionus calyciflorus]